MQEYKIATDVETLINADIGNEKLWYECKEVLTNGKQVFLSKVEELFICICCQEILYKPVLTSCKHNICQVSQRVIQFPSLLYYTNFKIILI